MECAAVLFLLIAAVTLRAWYIGAGVPYAVGIDEPQVVDRALRILRTGDWNTHLFDYPSLVIYFHALLAIGRYLWGATAGEWASLDGFDVKAVYTTGRLATALIGAATVWILYRLGTDLGSRRVGLLAAAQLAVHPMHVRESHFILTDVPVTALTTAALWLSVRAAERSTGAAYAWAGAASGLAAAAKYTGGIAFTAVAAVWLIHERREPLRWHTGVAALSSAIVAFLIAAPYTILDLPSFLNGFAAQFARFAGGARSGEPAWLVYIKHLSLAARFSVPAAVLGLAVVCRRRRDAIRWFPLIAFVGTYFYALATHAPVFGRYALPLIPPLCLFAAIAVVEAVRMLSRIPTLARPGRDRLFLAFAIVGMSIDGGVGSVRWIRDLRRPDTRTIAAEWLRQNLPPGTRMAVENSGPTYLGRAGFGVVATELLIEHPLEWYQRRVRYLVVSSTSLERYGEYLNAGPIVFQVAPTPQRWGPPIRIVRLD
jgi:4-amino-4-deoxy-L-arabinose transferase-like glycosyltransferase